MKPLLVVGGFIIGVTATIQAQRWTPYALVWLFSRGDR